LIQCKISSIFFIIQIKNIGGNSKNIYLLNKELKIEFSIRCEIDAGVAGARGLLQYHPIRRIVGLSGGARYGSIYGSDGRRPGKAARWPNTSVSEVMSYNNASTRKAIDSWLSTAYHRSIILDDQYTSVGSALQGGNAVINPAYFGLPEERPGSQSISI